MDTFPLSSHQKRLWSLQEPIDATFQARCTVQVDGPLDEERLEEALRHIVDRHGALRTAFQTPSGMALPVQTVASEGQVDWHALDRRGDKFRTGNGRKGGELDGKPHLPETLRAVAHRPFGLESLPLLRSLLVRQPEGRTLWHLAVPALCADAPSLRRVVEATIQVYRGETLGEDPLQYVQYAAWHQQRLDSEAAEQGREFWEQQDLDAAPRLRLSVEETPAADRPVQFGRATTVLDPELASRLASIEDGHTGGAFLMTCWQILIWMQSGRPDAEVVVGDAFHGREPDMLRDLVGPVAKYLPTSGRLDHDRSFRSVLDQVDRSRKNRREGHEFFVPGNGPYDEAEETAYFPFGFAYRRTESYEAEDTTFTLVGLESRFERHRAALVGRHVSDRLALELRYDATRFQPGGPEVLLQQLEQIIRQAARDPETAVGSFDPTSAAEKLLDEWPAGADRPVADPSPLDRLRRHVEATPDAPAVTGVDTQLTYHSLWRRAGRLARQLRIRGVRCETPVGVCLQRSSRLIETLVGVWRAGGAYLPLDPDDPAHRLTYMVDDAGAEKILAEEATADAVSTENAEVLLVEELLADGTTGESADVVLPEVEPEQLAYLIYTSGSTGRPKGVAVQHRSVANLVQALRRAVYPDDTPSGGPAASSEPLRVGVGAPITFDASVKQLGQVLEGHVLSVLPEDLRFDGTAFVRYGERLALQVVDVTPTQMHLVLRAESTKDDGEIKTRSTVGGDGAPSYDASSRGGVSVPEALGSRLPDRILVGGEAIPPHLWQTMKEIPETQFFNVYGPTECTVDVTTQSIDLSTGGRPHIGDPLSNVEVYVLDAQMEPVPVGVAGELYVGGAGLARGYRGRPRKTAEAFVPHPFADEGRNDDPENSRNPRLRLYRTGDRVQWRADGRLEFVGRIDRQVKVRGHRIELGEIESVLADQPGVVQAAVTVRGDDWEKRLVGYVAMPDGDDTGQQLRDQVAERLPEHMVPSEIEILGQMPLTPNGKIDYDALPDPSSGRPDLDTELVAPQTDVEERIAAIWRDVLEVETVGVEDNFFDLGGHSLLMIEAHRKLNEQMDEGIDLVDMFQHPTIRALAQFYTDGIKTPSHEDAEQRASKRREARRRDTRTR